MEQNKIDTAPGTVGGAPKKVGPIIMGSIVVLVIIAVGIYFFATRTDRDNMPAPTNQTGASTTVQTVKPITNTADDPQSLQNDLNNSTTGLDSQTF